MICIIALIIVTSRSESKKSQTKTYEIAKGCTGTISYIFKELNDMSRYVYVKLEVGFNDVISRKRIKSLLYIFYCLSLNFVDKTAVDWRACKTRGQKIVLS